MDINLTVVLTRDCNLRCTYCPTRKSKSGMSTHTLDRLAGLLSGGRWSHIQLNFHGGEPLLEFRNALELVDAIRASSAAECRPFLGTNGTLLTPSKLGELRARGFTLRFSCDGTYLSHALHRRPKRGGTRGAAVLYRKLLRNVMLSSRLGIPTRVNLVVSPATVSALTANYAFLQRLGAALIEISPEMGKVWHPRDLAFLEQQLDALGEMERRRRDPRQQDFSRYLAHKIRETAYFLGSGGKYTGALSILVDTDGGLYADEFDLSTRGALRIGSVHELRDFRDLPRGRADYFELVYGRRLMTEEILRSLRATYGLVGRHYRRLLEAS